MCDPSVRISQSGVTPRLYTRNENSTYVGAGGAGTRPRQYRIRGAEVLYEGEKEELVDSEKYAVSYEWTSGFYGEAVLSDIKLEDMLQELSDVDIKSKVEKKRNMGGAQA